MILVIRKSDLKGFYINPAHVVWMEIESPDSIRIVLSTTQTFLVKYVDGLISEFTHAK